MSVLPLPTDNLSNLKKNLQKLLFSNLNNIKVGLTLSLILQPFDVIRTSNIIKEKTSLTELVQFIKKTEGFRGFFRGGFLSCFKTSLSFTLFFNFIEKFQKMSQNYTSNYLPKNLSYFLTAAAARTITTTILSPIIVLKTRIECVGSNSNLHQNINSIAKNEGVFGFYRGIFPTLCRDVPYSGLQFAMYRNLQNVFERIINKKPQDVVGGSFCIGGFSSVLAIMITYPFDNVRIRAQISTGKNENIIKLVSKIFNQEGLKGFYKGYKPRILKKMIGGAIAWSFYEMFNKKKKNDNEY